MALPKTYIQIPGSNPPYAVVQWENCISIETQDGGVAEITPAELPLVIEALRLFEEGRVIEASTLSNTQLSLFDDDSPHIEVGHG